MTPIYLINLARRSDRLADMTARLHAEGLDFIRVDAADARTADPAWLAGQFAASAGDASHAVILEDDVRLAEGAGRRLGSLDWLPASTRLLKIEVERPRVLLGPPRSVGRDARIARLFSDHTCAAGYIISRSTAAALAAMQPKPTLMIDFLLFSAVHSPMFSRLRPDQLVPALVEQTRLGGTDSDIEPDRAALTQARMRPGAGAKLRREAVRLRNQARQLAPLDFGGARWTPVSFGQG
jgi:glycosyl transferase family 25